MSSGDPNSEGSWLHTWNECGWHYPSFERDPAFSAYRDAVNLILGRFGPGFRLNDGGQVERLVEPSLNDLELAAEDATPLVGDDEALVRSALAKFRRRDLASRRDAVRDLADVLERLRASAPGLMGKKDEGPPFEIANRYWIRHNKPDEAREYDHEIWWDWIFHLYLASIRLIQALQARADGAAESVTLLVSEVAGGTWYKGELAKRLDEINLRGLSPDSQYTIGVAVGGRCVRQSMTVVADGPTACATSVDLDIWPPHYRLGLLRGMFVDGVAQLDTSPALSTAAVRIIACVPDAEERLEAFVDEAVGLRFSARLSPPKVRGAVAAALADSALTFPVGRSRSAWQRLANRLAEGS